MKLKQMINIEIPKDDSVFVFSIPSGASYGVAYDAAFQVIQQILKMAQEAVDQTKPKSEPVEPEIVS